MEVLGRTEVLQQGPDSLGVVHGERDVMTRIRAESLERGTVMVAVRAGVDRHDQPVFHGHSGHLVHHVGLECLAVLRAGFARPGALKQPLRVGGVQLQGCGRADAVVSGHRTVFHEVAPS
ncbi:hypothetical protein D9M72_488960 [compost metagenome]